MHASETRHETELAAEMALVHAAKLGDMAAFEQLVRFHQGHVFASPKTSWDRARTLKRLHKKRF